MAVYKFRVSFEEFDEVTRDIEIRSTQTFEDLHKIILQSISFEMTPGASFFMSDDNWKKDQEISATEKTVIKNGEEKKTLLTSRSRLCDLIIDPHQKIYFIADAKGEWTFQIELMRIVPDQAGTQYPRVVKTAGEAPKQFGASALGKVSTEFDFFNESGIDQPEEGEEGEFAAEHKDEGEETEEEESDEVDQFGVDDFHEEH